MTILSKKFSRACALVFPNRRDYSEKNVERAIPILPADDLSVAKAFYIDGLGFRVIFETSKDGRSGLLGLERGTIQLTLDSSMKSHGRDACVSLQVDDTDAYYRGWRPRVTVLRAPQDEEWGARTFDLLDPSGNTIFVNGTGQREEAALAEVGLAPSSQHPAAIEFGELCDLLPGIYARPTQILDQ